MGMDQLNSVARCGVYGSVGVGVLVGLIFLGWIGSVYRTVWTGEDGERDTDVTRIPWYRYK
jgi:hypothetical protein